jgi:hypothetical protein
VAYKVLSIRGAIVNWGNYYTVFHDYFRPFFIIIALILT